MSIERDHLISLLKENAKKEPVVIEIEPRPMDTNETVVSMVSTINSEYKKKNIGLSLTELRQKMATIKIRLAKYHLALGHFYLLIYDYVKSLESYQAFLNLSVNKLKVI